MKRTSEKAAYEAIRSAGHRGILQSDLWRCLNTNSREGSRIATKLEKKGLVRRARELCEGRWTYRLYVDEPHQASDVIWRTLNNCPCFTCEQLPRCGPGQNISPNSCVILDKWLLGQSSGDNGAEEIPETDEASN